MRHALLLSVLLAGLAAALRAADVPGERDFIRAEILLDEGDTRRAVLLYLQLLRKGKEGEGDDNWRNRTRERMLNLGFSQPELFALDPDTIKPEELDVLAARVGKLQAQRMQMSADLDYAERLTRGAVSLQLDVGGNAKVSVNEPHLARAVETLLKVAFVDDRADQVAEAQGRLEGFGVKAPQLEELKKALADKKLPPEVLKEAVAEALCQRLEGFKDLQELPENEDAGHAEHRAVSRELALPLLKLLDAQYAQAGALKRHAETVNFWRGQGATPNNAAPNGGQNFKPTAP